MEAIEKEINKIISVVKREMKEGKKLTGEFLLRIDNENFYVSFLKKARTLWISTINKDFDILDIKKTTKIVFLQKKCKLIT